MKGAFILANTAAPTTTSIGPGAAPAAPAAAPAAPGVAQATVQQPAPAAPAQAQAQPPMPFWQNPLILMILVFGVMIFFTFRSQKKQQQKRAQMLDSIGKGDRVMLSNGIYGTIAEVRDKSYIVNIGDKDNKMNVEVVKGGVSEKVVAGAQPEQK